MPFVDFVRINVNKVYQRVQVSKNRNQEYKMRKEILDSFQEPADRMERSYFQYLCQMKSLNRLIKLAQNIMAAVCFPLCWLIFSLNTRKKRESTEAVYISDGIGKEIIPDSLFREYAEIVQLGYKGSFVLGKAEKDFIRSLLKRYWFSPFFCFKSLVKIGLYAGYISVYSPKAIIAYNEYSFTSSLLTEYCHTRGIEQINVLHGEKMFNFRDSFVSYDRFYVWDDYYKSMFVAMRAEPGQFRVELPRFLQSIYSVGTKTDPEYDYTYYLGIEPRNTLVNIRNSLDLLRKKGYRVCIRIHPRSGAKAFIRQFFSSYAVEDPSDISLLDSLSNTRAVISIYSTVLYQAYLLGKTVIIDDIADPAKYSQLADLGYIMLNKPHDLLSAGQRAATPDVLFTDC